MNARTNQGVEIDLALFGVEQGSYIDPGVAEGQVVISETAAEEGVEVGDIINLEPTGYELEVVEILDRQYTFGTVDIGYLSLNTWQEIRAGVRSGDMVPDRVDQKIKAVAVKAESGSSIDLAAEDSAAGTTSLTRTDSYNAFPGFIAEHRAQRIRAILAAVAAEVFPDWMDRVLKRVEAAPTPGARVWAYIEENVAIFSSRELAVAQVLARVVPM